MAERVNCEMGQQLDFFYGVMAVGFFEEKNFSIENGT